MEAARVDRAGCDRPEHEGIVRVGPCLSLINMREASTVPAACSYTADVTKVDLSDAIQDDLKEIYKFAIESERVATSSLARRQQVSPASASAMVKKLAVLGLAEHTPYRGVTLTHAGEQVALEVIRHHRLLELYLAETLGIDVDDVHQEADRLEHALSEELEARIDKALGFPTHDPHGEAIPNAKLEGRKNRPSYRPKKYLSRTGRTSLRVNGFTLSVEPSSSSTRASSSSAPFAASRASTSS